MSEKEVKEEKENVLSIDDVLEEKEKPIYIPIAGMEGKIPYIFPTGVESDKLAEQADIQIKVIVEREKINAFDSNGKRIPGSQLSTTKELERKKQEIVSNLRIMLGLQKADKTVTKEKFSKLPPEVKSQISLCLAKVAFAGVLGDGELGDLKNLLELTRD